MQPCRLGENGSMLQAASDNMKLLGLLTQLAPGCAAACSAACSHASVVQGRCRVINLGSAPADMRGCASNLRKLELNGNALQALQDGIGALSAHTRVSTS